MVAVARVPFVIFLDGATGSGKSTILQWLSSRYPNSLKVGRKLTTRPQRPGGTDSDHTFVSDIPVRHSKFAYTDVGAMYAINLDEVEETLAANKCYAVSCTRPATVEEFRFHYSAIYIYVFRPACLFSVSALMFDRGVTDAAAIQARMNEIEECIPKYSANITQYDHVILNASTGEALLLQVSNLLLQYGLSAADAKNAPRRIP